VDQHQETKERGDEKARKERKQGKRESKISARLIGKDRNSVITGIQLF